MREHYREGRWTPNVALQMQGDTAAAMRIAREFWAETRKARVVALELAQFQPVGVLSSQDLSQG